MFTCVFRSRSRLENDDLAMMNDVIGVARHLLRAIFNCGGLHRCTGADATAPLLEFRELFSGRRERFYQWPIAKHVYGPTRRSKYVNIYPSAGLSHR